ncbi:MAG: HDOD domain-containing protein [Proteobacteria bacterium]|nr:HDOD domain-containing protein [Pseudomonadota bacterium]MBU1639821.1 HDOD domain-containing protein [Pseudomonadota bacterium]
MATSQKASKNEKPDPRLVFLKKIAFFTPFDDHELKQLLSLSRWLKVPPFTHIIKENTTDRVLYILVYGTVSVFKTVGDGEVELSTLSPGATFGEMAMIAETKRTAGVRTLTDAYILMVEPEILNHANVFLQLKFYKRFCEILVQRLVDANKKMAGAGKVEPAAVQKVEKKKAVSEKIKAKRLPVDKPQQPSESSLQLVVSASELPAIPLPRTVAKSRMQRRVQSNLELAINPAVSSLLASFLVGDCEDTRRFSELIGLDPFLAAKVLQVANSSFYRRSTEVSSVAHALVTVGIKNVQEVVSEELEKGGRHDAFSGFNHLARSFWRHSVVVGRIAELLAEVVRVHTYEDIYLAGLLHDIGMLSLDLQEPDFYPQLQRVGFLDSISLCEAEYQYMGADHCQVGYYLAEKMGLPKAFLDAAKFHHHPERAKEHLLIVALVALAELFAVQRGIVVGCTENAAKTSIDESFAWILLTEQQKAFMNVDVGGFIHEFQQELDRSWANIVGDMSL